MALPAHFTHRAQTCIRRFYIRDRIAQPPGEPPPVWPHPKGDVRGVALYPLYPSVPQAAARNAAPYELLALFDALRASAGWQATCWRSAWREPERSEQRCTRSRR